MTNTGLEVTDFYKNAKIFITGGTGFLGKVIISKLLQSCKHLDRIYVLIRVKKNKDPQTRIDELFQQALFEPLKKKHPDAVKKVVCIPGDISSLRMGISDEHYETLKREVTHVIHAAATVRFNEKLKNALRINVLGTCEAINFCNECAQLKVFVYVSTAFVRTHHEDTLEKIKEPPISREHALNLMNALTEEQLDLLTPSLIKPWPNTYSFTKAIAESCILHMVKDYPTVVFRPSMVCGSLKEPLEGWIDNLYGPTGLLIGAGVGLVRVALGNNKVTINFVPVDMSVNALICSAWEGNKEYYENTTPKLQSLDKQKKVSTNPKVYNFVPTKSNSITIQSYMEKNRKLGLQYPSNQSIWYCTVITTKHKLWFNILFLLLHFVPGFFMDLGFILLGRKPQFFKIYKKIYEYYILLSIYSLNDWKLTHRNIPNLWKNISEKEKNIFYFDMKNLNWDEYFKITVLGIRFYLLKETESNLPQARRRLFFLWLAHRTLQMIFIGLLLWFVNKYIYTFIQL